MDILQYSPRHLLSPTKFNIFPGYNTECHNFLLTFLHENTSKNKT